MNTDGKNFSRKSLQTTLPRMVETIFGCKWSLTVYQLIKHGICRPGEMVRSTEGLSKKVLYDCLNKNVEFGILERIVFSEVPPKVEYSVTKFGSKFLRILDEIEKLQFDLDSENHFDLADPK